MGKSAVWKPCGHCAVSAATAAVRKIAQACPNLENTLENVIIAVWLNDRTENYNAVCGTDGKLPVLTPGVK